MSSDENSEPVPARGLELPRALDSEGLAGHPRTLVDAAHQRLGLAWLGTATRLAYAAAGFLLFVLALQLLKRGAVGLKPVTATVGEQATAFAPAYPAAFGREIWLNNSGPRGPLLAVS